MGLLVWAGFHMWEQWAAFGGRERFVTRLLGTSTRAPQIAIEVTIGVAPVLAWIVIEVILRTREREPEPLAAAMSEVPAVAERLGKLVRVASWITYAWLAYHLAWLWLPKLLEGPDPLVTWTRLRELGTWARAIPLALGLSAMVFHLWGAFVRFAIAFELVKTPEMRRAARASGLIVALGLLLLYAQLAGWHAAGAGSVWPL